MHKAFLTLAASGLLLSLVLFTGCADATGDTDIDDPMDEQTLLEETGTASTLETAPGATIDGETIDPNL